MARMRGHKRGCRCVGCSPKTRAKGMRAMKRAAKNPRRKRRSAAPTWQLSNPATRKGSKYATLYCVEVDYVSPHGGSLKYTVVADGRRMGTYRDWRDALDVLGQVLEGV